MLLDRHRTGTAAQSIGALSLAAQGVRDQLSEDVWIVLADIERALAALAANPYDQGLQLTDASERVLSGLLALCGIASENMIRDPGWYMLDSGRGLERALQVIALLKVTLGRQWTPGRERLIIEAVLTAAESIVTFRRRYRGRTGVEAVVDLLVTRRFESALGGLPAAADPDRPARGAEHLADRPPAATAGRPGGAGPDRRSGRAGGDGRRPPTGSGQLRQPACSSSCGPCRRRSAISTSRQPPTQQPLFRAGAVGAMTSYRIVHRTTYTYDSEVTGSYGQFHLRPRDLPWQTCLAHEIDIEPEPADLFRHIDLYGNTKAYFHVVRPHTRWW